ncbi:MAG: YjjG family noncanonical pyrimidine nucleotidase [Bacteroidales bacterium]|jgi:putative hydrolase of the HAD superfamily
MTEKLYKHIFFDLDRTLWDFGKNSSEVLKEIIEEFSLEQYVRDEDEFIEKYNYYNDNLWDMYRGGKIKKPLLRQERFRLLLKDYKLADMRLVEGISRFYLNTCPVKPLVIGHTVEVLEYLYEKYRLYIISNGFYDVQLTKMISSGISKYFKKVFTSDRIGYAKPNARIFEYALKSENAKKTESLMIGDDILNDVQGAKNTRIDQVYFNPEKNDLPFVPTYVISDLLELKDIL